MVCVIMAMFMNITERQHKSYKRRRDADIDNFKAMYRFTEENVDWLAQHFLGPDSGETRGGALTNSQKMRTFLLYVGDPGFQVGVGEDIGIYQTTANKIIWFVCQKIVARAGEWIRFPSSENEMNEAKNVWLINNLIPNAIGVVDCTHILIIRPHEHGDEFVNQKGLNLFNVQATCDGKYMFTSVDCSSPDSVHDARIWRNSNVMQSIYENATGASLLADDGYGIAPWLITPYRETATPAQRLFNKIHAKERVAIECVFGQVKKRFPILQSKIRMTTSRVPSMILACFVLHNIAKILHDEDFEYFEHEIEVVNMPLRENTGNNNEKSRGIQRRDAIAAFLSG